MSCWSLGVPGEEDKGVTPTLERNGWGGFGSLGGNKGDSGDQEKIKWIQEFRRDMGDPGV